MLDFYKILCDCTLSNITEDFTKSYSINRLYTVASQMLYIKLKEVDKYDFDSLIEWIISNKNVWYKGKWKAVKHFTYMMDDIYHNRDFPIDGKYTYFNNTSNYLKLNNEHRKLIDDFIKTPSLNYNSIKNYVAYFLRCLELSKVKLEKLSYKDIYDFICKNNNHSSEVNFSRMLNYISRFLEYCYEKKVIDNILLAFITDKKVIGFYEYLSNINLEISNLSTDNSLSQSLFCRQITSFMNLMKENDYSRHHLMHAPYVIEQFALFVDMFHLPICYETINLFCLDILKNLISSYKESRTLLYRYFDYINGKPINFNSCYCFKEKNYIKSCPSWARQNIDDYLNYRKRLGYKKNTLKMDANSILRFTLYLDKTGVDSFNKITPHLLCDFKNRDYHSTVEGKNAYLIRIRQFLCYLYDKKIIPNYHESILLKGYRLPKKLIVIMDLDTLELIYNHKNDFKTELELRSYCLFLLGVRMGLRATDAINLKRKDISLKKLTITFTQAKTMKQLTLPMPVMVANSIYRYMKSLHHISNHDFLFQTLHAPYRVPSKTVCNSAIKIVLDKLEIDYKGITFHTLRRTYASNIVSHSYSTTDAAYALGHADDSTVDKYLSLDKTRMRNCCMDLHLVPYGGLDI